MSTTTTILIFLPGTGGTSLVKYANLSSPSLFDFVWPTNVTVDAKLGSSDEAETLITLPGLAQQSTPEDDTLMAYQPLDAYQPLIDFLKTTLKVTEGQKTHNATAYVWNYDNTTVPVVGTSSAPGHLVVSFPYDWRQNNTWSAGQLQSLITAIDKAYTSASQSYQIVLLAHSMGGLVARSYLENVGANDQFNVKALITLATPHLGAPVALDSLIGGPLMAVITDPIVNALINDSNFPSTFELLPPPSNPATQSDGTTSAGGFVIDTSNSDAVISIYTGDFNTALTSATNASTPGFGANQTNLTSAQAFFETLTGTPPSGVSYYGLYGLSNVTLLGDGSKDGSAQDGTVTSYNWTSASDGPGTVQSVPTTYSTLNADNVPTNVWTGGDGIVPVWSAMFYGNNNITTFPIVGANHLTIPANATAQQQIATWLATIMNPS